MTGGDCGSDHCVTCADEGVPMRVVRNAEDGVALCADEAGTTTDVMTDLVQPVKPGDVVLVHAGVALAVTENAERFS